MRARLWTIVIAAHCLSGLLWANGEAWETVLRDPNTGVLVPTRRTPVRIEREQLQITLLDNRWHSYYNLKEPYGFQVQATYYLHNPTSQPQRLAVAFPIPYPALFTETPVLLDGRPLEWRYFDPFDVFRWHRKELAAHFEKWLSQRPNLRATFERAYRWWRASRPRNKANPLRREMLPDYFDDNRSIYVFPKEAVSQQQLERALREISSARATRSVTGDSEYTNEAYDRAYLSDLWTTYLLAKGEHDFIAESIPEILSLLGYTPSLIKQWEIGHKFLEPMSNSLHTPERLEADDWVIPEPWEVSVLMFEFSIAPNTRAELTVRYAHPVGIRYPRSAIDPELNRNHQYGDEYVAPFWHFTYVLKVRPTWAYFGPIDVTFRIPESMRLRASPRLAFAKREAGWRIYRATLQPYRQNLYAVVAPELHFRPRLELDYHEETILRQLEPGRLYLPVQHLERLRIRGQQIFTDIKTSATTVNLTAQFDDSTVPIRLQVGSHTAYVSGKEVRLSAPVKMRDGQVWIPVRALEELLNGRQQRVSVEYDPRSGLVTLDMAR